MTDLEVVISRLKELVEDKRVNDIAFNDGYIRVCKSEPFETLTDENGNPLTISNNDDLIRVCQEVFEIGEYDTDMLRGMTPGGLHTARTEDCRISCFKDDSGSLRMSVRLFRLNPKTLHEIIAGK